MGPQPEYLVRKTEPDEEIVAVCLRLLDQQRELAALGRLIRALHDTPENRVHIASMIRLVLDIFISEGDWHLAGMAYARYGQRLTHEQQEQYEEAIQDIAPVPPVTLAEKVAKKLRDSRREHKRAA
jgi:hypothetical protein